MGDGAAARDNTPLVSRSATPSHALDAGDTFVSTPSEVRLVERGHIMGFIAFLVLGLIAGAIAKAILPGEQGGGWFTTLLLGVVGAMLGGWLGGMLFGANLGEFWSLESWLVAIGGSIVVLLLYGLIVGRRKSA